MKHYLVLVKIIIFAFSIISCKQEKRKNNLTSQDEKKSFAFSDVIGEKYRDKKLIKQIDFEYNGKKLKSYFLLREEGELGASGFAKELDVLIFENDNLLDEFSFRNESALCDLKVLINEASILTDNNKQSLFFPIIHSCDGEEPELLVANIWNGKKKEYELEIPVYFENSNSKTNFFQRLESIHFESKQVKNRFYNLVSKITNINFSDIKLSNSKVDKENPKCITKSNISLINSFLSKPNEEKFLQGFDKNDNVNLNTVISYLENKKCLGKDVSLSDIKNCNNSIKCEVYCSYNVTQEDIDDGELSEEIMYVYFNKSNGILSLDKIEFEGR